MRGSVPELWKCALCGTLWGSQLPVPTAPLIIDLQDPCFADLRDEGSFAELGCASTFLPAELAKASGKFQILNGALLHPGLLPILPRAASKTSYPRRTKPEAIELPLLLRMDFRLQRRL